MRKSFAKGLIAAFVLVAASPGLTQNVQTVDPNTIAAQSDVAPLPGERGTAVTPPAAQSGPADPATPDSGIITVAPASVETPPASTLATRTSPTWRKDDLIGAAEGVFGKGAAGLANLVERILADQGEPNAYIAGREASVAFVVGLRYGSGTMKHSVEGERAVYWTGPSIGFDVGGDATKVFTLVYNLYDSQDLYKRYPQAEGRAYFVGGFSATYLRRDSVVLIPVRLGVGLRLGANIGYMNFTEKSRFLPF
jgi:hypothetical protein